MRLRQVINLIMLSLVLLAGSQFVLAQEAPLTGFDDYVNKAIRCSDKVRYEKAEHLG